MTDMPHPDPVDPRDGRDQRAGGGSQEGISDDKPFNFTDKRKVTPEGQPRGSGGPGAGSPGPAPGDPAPGPTPGGAAGGAGRDPAVPDSLAGLDFEPSLDATADAALLAARAEAAEHLESLLRERASFTNYRNRSLRDQEAARTRGIEDVLTGILPVLDAIDRARQHGELTGPFAAISDILDAKLAEFGIERYGAVGEEFDPNVHDALMHQVDPDVAVPTVNLIIEPGYRIGEKVVRAARVSVVGPE